MSINLKDFESGNFKRRPDSNEDTQQQRILEFLKSNKRAFKPNDIAKKLKMHPNSVRCALGRLKTKGRVRHKTPYYAFRR